jgi:hypothetical protein
MATSKVINTIRGLYRNVKKKRILRGSNTVLLLSYINIVQSVQTIDTMENRNHTEPYTKKGMEALRIDANNSKSRYISTVVAVIESLGSGIMTGARWLATAVTCILHNMSIHKLKVIYWNIIDFSKT